MSEQIRYAIIISALFVIAVSVTRLSHSNNACTNCTNISYEYNDELDKQNRLFNRYLNFTLKKVSERNHTYVLVDSERINLNDFISINKGNKESTLIITGKNNNIDLSHLTYKEILLDPEQVFFRYNLPSKNINYLTIEDCKIKDFRSSSELVLN
jgi:hypothetical protein